MAEEPVKKRTRKTTAKKVVRKTPVVVSTDVSTKKTTKTGLSLKFVRLTILFLFLASGGAFYIGYSADGAIDVNGKLADDSTLVDGSESGTRDSTNNPPPLKERPNLEPATEPAAPTPESEPVVEGVATSTNELVEENQDDTVVDEGSSELPANIDESFNDLDETASQ